MRPSNDAGHGGGTTTMAAGCDPGLMDVRSEPARGWPLVLLALAAGWGALLSYSAFFLTEDGPVRPVAVAETVGSIEPAARVEAARFEAAPIPLPNPPAPAVRTVAPRIDDVPVPPVRPVGEVRAVEPRPVATEPVPPRSERVEYAGTWGPTAAACGAPSRRRGYLPATITPDRAKAGRVICNFHDGHRTGNAWVLAADCVDRGRRWSSQVRLVVDGDRLTWSSAKGSSSYVRCNRRTG